MTETVHRIPLRASFRIPDGAMVLVGEWRQHHPATARGWVRAYSFVLTAPTERPKAWTISFRLPDDVEARVNPQQTFTRFEVVHDGPHRFRLDARPGHFVLPGGTLAVDLQLLHPTRPDPASARLLDLAFT